MKKSISFSPKSFLNNFTLLACTFVMAAVLFPMLVLAQLPTDFQKVELLDGLKNSVNFEFAPDGRVFILDRYGTMLIFKPDTQTSVVAGDIDVFHNLEDGLLAIAFDPDFENNQFIYLHHSPSAVSVNRVSRFQMQGDVINMASEVVLIEWPTQRECCFHSAGDMDFDSQGNLYIATGDNSDHTKYASLNESNANESSENTSSNTNDLRGKILRIKPEENGTYSIPEGNLFPDGNSGRPEIYVMGARNPFKIFVDKTNTDWLFWGEVGPDANVDSNLGPKGLDEINLTKKAGNYGWPYFSGKNIPYLNTYADPTFYYDPNNPINLSKWNSGAVNLPPAVPSWLDFFHQCYLAGPRYYFDPAVENPRKLPSQFDQAFFYYDFNTSKVWVVEMDDAGAVISNEQMAPDIVKGDGFIDAKIGPDGQLYMLEYGTGCCATNAGSGKLVRVDYIGIDPNRSPHVNINADITSGSLPLTVNFSSEGSSDLDGDALTYEWDFQSDGIVDSHEKNPSFTYTQEGTFDAQLRVNDSNGGINARSIKIYAGNNQAAFEFIYPPDGGMMNWNDHVDYHFVVSDQEDGTTYDATIDCEDVNMVPSFGHLNHFHDGLSINACEGSYYLDPSGHDTDGEDDIFMVFNVNYTDSHGLTSYDQLMLHPKLMEAEFYDLEDKTHLIDNTDQLGGGRYSVRALYHNAYIMLAERNLHQINSVSYRVASNLGGNIEIRSDSPTGSLLSRVQVPMTGGLNNWTTIEAPLTDPGGKHDLYFVFKNSPGDGNLFDLNYFEFQGAGVSLDASPAEINAVQALSPNQLRVKFNEPLKKSSAEQAANYSINQGISISGAVLQEDNRTVILNMSDLSPQVSYTLTISNLENESGVVLKQSIAEDFQYTDVLYRINGGGPAMQLADDNWEENQFNNGGNTYSTSSLAIHNTDSDEIYWTELYADNFSYSIPVPREGYYDVTLHFAEIFHGVKNTLGVGARLFNVNVENGQFSLNNYDIIEKAGAPATAIAEIFRGVKVEDGSLEITFSMVKDKAKISAIEVAYGEAPILQPSITILSPKNAAQVAQPFDLVFEVENWEVGNGTTHIHQVIDGIAGEGIYSTDPITFNDLPLGNHTIQLVLANDDHTQTEVADQIEVNVMEELDCPDIPFPLEWDEQTVGSQLTYRSVHLFSADIDGDDHKDIITGGWWYKNPGSSNGTWEMKVIGAPMHNMSVVYDFDNDGDPDIFGTQGTYVSSEMAWAENDGQGNFTIHTNIPAGVSTYAETFMAGVAVGNFNAVSNVQIAVVWNGAESSNSPVQMLTVPADPVNQDWTITAISEDSYGEAISAGDIDGDGDLDLFQGVNWLRNDGVGNWTTFPTGISLPTHFDRNLLADLDGDGRLEGIVTQIGNNQEVFWFKAPADPTQAWAKHSIGQGVYGALSLDVADINEDGNLDVVIGEWQGAHRLIGYKNDLCNSGTWVEHVLHPGGSIDHHDGAQTVDIDNDGDLDIISVGWDERIPRIYVNNSGTTPENIPPVVANPIPNQQATEGLEFAFAFEENTFSDADGDALSYAAGLANGNPLPSWLSFDHNTRTLSGTPQASDIGVYNLQVTASDGKGGTVEDSFELIVQSPGVNPAIRLNTGGPMYTAGSGEVFENDQYFSSSSTFNKVTSIANTTDDALYYNERFGKSFSYNIPLPSGTYVVKLHLAEIHFNLAGQRVFSVTAEGQPFLSNYDILAEVGYAAAVVKQAQVSVTDGTLNLAFSGHENNGKISAIEVIGLTSSNSPSPVVDAGEDQTISLPNNSASFTATASVTEGSIVSYVWEKLSGPEASLSGAGSATLSLADLLEGSYVFKITVTDDLGATASDQVQLRVNPAPSSNIAPEANAGSDQVLMADSEGQAEVQLDGSASNDLDGTIFSYVWTIDGAEIATGPRPAISLPLGTHTITLTVTDNEEATGEDQVQVTINNKEEPPAYRLNAGGGQYLSGGGLDFAEDQYFSTSNTYAKYISIENTTDDQLYQQERFGKSFSYNIPLPSGGYLVKLHFAEIFFTSAGKRVFSVTAEGEPFLSNYDIVADAGHATAVVKEMEFSVTDGTLNLAFSASVENAKIAAIEIMEVSSGATNKVPVANAGSDQVLMADSEGQASVQLDGSGSTDEDGSILSYVWTKEEIEIATGINPTLSLGVGTHTIELTVTDNEDASDTDQVMVEVNSSPGETFFLRLNAGGAPYTDGNGELFSEDQYFSPSSTFAKSINIENSIDDKLYQSERYGKNFSYSIPVPSGSYKVKMHFAEIYFNSAGERVFSVTAEGEPFLNNYDIVADAGYATATVKEIDVAVNDGTLNLAFTASVNNAKLSAVEIIESGSDSRDQVEEGHSEARTAQVKAYPNTFSKVVKLDFDGLANQEYEVKVYTLLGKLLYENSFMPESGNESIHSIDLSDPAIGQGMYLIQVGNKDNSFKEVIRIVKIQ